MFPTAPHRLPGRRRVAASPRPHFARLLEGEQTETEIRPRAASAGRRCGVHQRKWGDSCIAVVLLNMFYGKIEITWIARFRGS